MYLSIVPLQSERSFAAEVVGLDMKKPLTQNNVSELENAMSEYAVLLFRGQELSDSEQLEFAKNFGPIENSLGTVRKNDRVSNGIADISNLDEDNRPLRPDDRRRIFNMGNMLWHSDSSFNAVPGRYSILSARVIPSVGGDTEFADMRAAYEQLDEPTKAVIEPLVCEHSLIYSRAKLGFASFTEEERLRFAPVLQRLVRTHPSTGRKSLFLSAHIGKVLDFPLSDGLVLINNLTEHATQREFRFRHAWQQHDVIMWDNRVTMHRGHAYDESQPRDMRRFTTVDDGPTVAIPMPS